MAIAAARAADAKKGDQIVVLDIGDLMVVTDFFVIVTASNRILMRTVAEEIEGRLSDLGVKPIGREGRANGGWLLVDFGSVVCHVFDPEARDFYRLEKLWGNAGRVDWEAQEAVEQGA